MSSDVGWHIRDKLWPMHKHGSMLLYVHTETIRLIRTAESPGRSPRLSLTQPAPERDWWLGAFSSANSGSLLVSVGGQEGSEVGVYTGGGGGGGGEHNVWKNFWEARLKCSLHAASQCPPAAVQVSDCWIIPWAAGYMYVGPCWEQRESPLTVLKIGIIPCSICTGVGRKQAHAATRSHRANCDSAGMNISGQFYLRNANKQNERAITHPNWTVPPTPHAMPALTVLHMTRHSVFRPTRIAYPLTLLHSAMSFSSQIA